MALYNNKRHFYSSQKVIRIKSNIQPVILVIFLL
jgi:hypothetical protein